MYYLLFVYNFHYTKLAVCTLNMLVMSFYINEFFFLHSTCPDVPLKLIICSRIAFEKKNQAKTFGWNTFLFPIQFLFHEPFSLKMILFSLLFN